MNKQQIRFKDLSWPIKIGIIGGFSFAVYFLILFIYGFTLGVMGP